MPRIYTSASDPIDFCWDCFPTERRAIAKYGDIGDGPDGRGNCFAYDSDHPEYDYSGYTCEDCGKELTSEDDYV